MGSFVAGRFEKSEAFFRILRVRFSRTASNHQ
jgi:hypothetical protein